MQHTPESEKPRGERRSTHLEVVEAVKAGWQGFQLAPKAVVAATQGERPEAARGPKARGQAAQRWAEEAQSAQASGTLAGQGRGQILKGLAQGNELSEAFQPGEYVGQGRKSLHLQT